ncbi:MAG TPA: ABC transporter permease [Candidatus Limnocylindria bacterium]|nr:ABC transporter permease [Candidatus Limnocylindria bacterium]
MSSWRARLAPSWAVAQVPVYSIVLAFAVAAVVIIFSSTFTATGFDPLLPFAAYGRLVAGSFLSGNAIANTLVSAAPLMFGGLAVGVGLKAGLFNIGVAGQFLVGAFAAAVVGSSLADAPTVIAMPLAMLAGAAGGAAYGFIPGYLKARTGAHEVVTTIMLNNAAVLLLNWAVNDLVRAPGFTFPRTGEIGLSALPILLGRNLHLGIVFAVATIFVTRWILTRTTLGFEIRTVGANPSAARYAGMRPVFITALTMTLSGLLAGLAGATQILGVIGFYAPGITATVGFDSIAVALLGRSDPIGILFAAILFGAFRAGAPLMQIETSVPIEVIDIIQALVILFLAADLIVRRIFRVRAPKVEITELATVSGSWGGSGGPSGAGAPR